MSLPDTHLKFEWFDRLLFQSIELLFRQIYTQTHNKLSANILDKIFSPYVSNPS